MEEAPLVIALGPGFSAGRDAHYVIETNRGHNLGRIIQKGCADPNTGIPGSINGFTVERLLRAPAAGVFLPLKEIGDLVKQGEIIGRVGEAAVEARIDGVLRGLMRPFVRVDKGLRIGDIDPRGDVAACHSISDKARAIAGSVLEAVLRTYNLRLDFGEWKKTKEQLPHLLLLEMPDVMCEKLFPRRMSG
jgi:xanthine dehydrogenase accessory factor